MTGRDRVKAAMHHRPVDKAPVQIFCSPVGFYEHGEKLNDLYESLSGDFGPYVRQPVTGPEVEDFDSDGKYHAFRKDGWGTTWEYHIYGVAGIACRFPLADLSSLDAYAFPAPPPCDEETLASLRRATQLHQERYYALHEGGSLFERMIALRPDEDVLCDIALDEPAIHKLADRIIEHNAHLITRAVGAGADGIAFGDDYGTERALIMSPAMWRGFFKPRLRALFEPAVRAGLDIHFHSCGQIGDILEDLREIGVTSIWPQLPCYDMRSLADRCRALGLAVAIHTDRANVMTNGTPQQVRDLVLREFETFRMMDGGSWFFVETDNGFPFENIEAMVETINRWR